MLTAILMEAISHFLADCTDSNTKFLTTCGGVNNVVFYVERTAGIEHVLRIYNNGNDTSKVEYEHSVLLQLNKMNLSFSLPETIRSAESGNSYVTLSNGACACLFKLIPGSLPKLTNVQDIGRVSGELNQAMLRVNLSKMPVKCPNPPYYDLYKVHHAVTRELFREKILSADIDNYRSSADFILEEICSTEERIAIYQNVSPSLPIQLIHGDLHYDNVLCDHGKVTGLLDFEFCAMDWNAMEVAICLSKYAARLAFLTLPQNTNIGEPDPLSYFELFLTGFAEKGTLSSQEIAAVPYLIILRILSNVVYFVGRAIAGEDSLVTLTDRIATYCKRVSWIKSNATVISDLITSKFTAKHTLDV